jgi:hypothetical protein
MKFQRNFARFLKIYETFCETVNSEIYFVSTLTTVYREYIPIGFKVIVKSEVGGVTDKSTDFLPTKWSLNSGTGKSRCISERDSILAGKISRKEF